MKGGSVGVVMGGNVGSVVGTLGTEINVRSGINVRAGSFTKNNKRTVWNKSTGGKI